MLFLAGTVTLTAAPVSAAAADSTGAWLQAETADLSGATVSEDDANAYGGAYVSARPGDTVTWPLPNLDAGSYYATVRYSEASNGSLAAGAVTYSLPATGTSWSQRTEQIDIRSGADSLTYQVPAGSAGLRLDAIWLSKAVGNGVVDQPIGAGPRVTLSPFATMPNTTTGKAPRLTVMAYTGSRLFVGEEHEGHIYEIVDDGWGPTPKLFLDLSTAIPANTGGRKLNIDNAMHGGLRGLAFHPDFATNGKFYVSVMEDRPDSTAGHKYISDVPDPVAADSVLIEWTYDWAKGQVDENSYRELFRVGMPVYDHPIKQIAFNQFAQPGSADYGLLYVAHGDGSVQSATAGGGQQADARGKILRINPLETRRGPYSIPATNPFAGSGSAMPPEVYSYGHRNPHNISFTRNGSLLAAEPGRDNVEEVNIIRPGADYGWPQREGTFVHRASEAPEGAIQGVEPLRADEAGYGFTYPAVEVGHEAPVRSTFNGSAIAGGSAVENGSRLDGSYLFAEFAFTGRLFLASVQDMYAAKTTLKPGEQPSTLTHAPVQEASIAYDDDHDPATPSVQAATIGEIVKAAPTYANTGRVDLQFGRGPSGEVYVMSKQNNMIYRVDDTVPAQ